MLKEFDIVNQILGHRLQQADIKRILGQLSAHDQALFKNQIGDILRKTSALLEVSRRVSETLDLDVLLPRMVKLITELLGAERSTIFLHDNVNDRLYSKVAEGGLTFEIRIPSKSGIAGLVFNSGDPIHIADPYNHPHFNPEVDKESGYITRNILCAPVYHRSKIIGVIQALNSTKEHFENSDLTLLCAISANAAVGFENARLHDQVIRARAHEAKLLDVTTAITQELHLKPLLIKIMRTVTNFLEADRSTLFLYDMDSNELWSHIAQGTDEIRFPANLGIAGSVFGSGQTINIPDAYQDKRFNSAFDKKNNYKTDTILCMPLQTKTGIRIGVIQVINKRDGVFTATDERRLAAFAAQASIAIENAKLFEEVVEVKNYNESILQSMSNGMITIDADNKLVTANHAGLSFFGKNTPLDTWAGEKAQDIFGEQNRWVLDAIEKVSAKSEGAIALDMDLALPLGKPDRSTSASVNLTTVPLKNAKLESMGCMLMVEDISKEKRLRGTMSRYVPKEVADRLLEGEGNALGGALQEATVLFSDIRSFTTISEQLGAKDTVAMLNEYFSIMVDLISNNHGILDKYIGDAIMAVFGAPFTGPKDADNAVHTAVEMMKALRPFNQHRQLNGKLPINIGIGLNTGEVVSGNIGSPKRMDYTVIGDGVNLAARLEGATKPYGTPILISEFTKNAIKDHFMLREIDRIRVKGKKKPVGIFEVLDHLQGVFEELDTVNGRYHEGLKRYKERDWTGAMQHFELAVKANGNAAVSKMYIDRCKHFMTTPPPQEWDGVWVMTTK